MLLALDESGKDGMRPMPGRSPWLVIGGLLFPSRPAAEACRVSLVSLRARLGGGEFRFSKTNDKRRREVLGCLAEQEFTFHTAVCDRNLLCPVRWRRKNADDLYMAVAGLLVATVSPRLSKCDVLFDTLGGKRPNERYAGLWVRSAGLAPGGVKRVKSCAPRDSQDDLVVQAADYICGAVARSLRPTDGDPSYLKLLRRREGELVTWTEPASPDAVVGNEEGGQLSPPAPP